MSWNHLLGFVFYIKCVFYSAAIILTFDLVSFRYNAAFSHISVLFTCMDESLCTCLSFADVFPNMSMNGI